MRIAFIFFAILLRIQSLFAQQDYMNYHRAIVRAEEHLGFERFDLALKVYDSVFQAYPFIFCKDYVIALQSAALLKDTSAMKRYALGAMGAGAKLSALERLPLIRNWVDQPCWRSVVTQYDTLRNNYKKSRRLDVNRQLSKNFREDEDNKSDKEYANKVFRKNIEYIKAIIDSLGFPGERLIGIDDADFDPGGTNHVAKLRDTDYSPNTVIVACLHYDRSIEFLGLPLLERAMRDGLLRPSEFASIYTFNVDLMIKMGKRKPEEIQLPRLWFDFPFGISPPDPLLTDQFRSQYAIRSKQTDKRLEDILFRLKLVTNFGY
jgi:hypothetical protein